MLKNSSKAAILSAALMAGCQQSKTPDTVDNPEVSLCIGKEITVTTSRNNAAGCLGEVAECDSMAITAPHDEINKHEAWAKKSGDTTAAKTCPSLKDGLIAKFQECLKKVEQCIGKPVVRSRCEQ